MRVHPPTVAFVTVRRYSSILCSIRALNCRAPPHQGHVDVFFNPSATLSRGHLFLHTCRDRDKLLVSLFSQSCRRWAVALFAVPAKSFGKRAAHKLQVFVPRYPTTRRYVCFCAKRISLFRRHNCGLRKRSNGQTVVCW